MDEYKKMILALPEDFFKGWVWQAGDKFLHKELGSEHWNECVTGDYKADLEGVIWYVVPDYYDRLEGEIRPLPSQKQLQDMMNLSTIEFIEDFYGYAQEPLKQDQDNEQFKSDMECFTLAYEMERKYKKFWNGEAWI